MGFLHELADACRIDRRSHPLGNRFGCPLEAHEAADEGIEPSVRGVALGPREQRVQPMLRVRHAVGHRDAKPPEPRRSDGDEQRRNGLATVANVREPLCDEFAAG